MRVLHITPAYYPATYWGGPIFSVYALNNALASFSGVELKVLTTDTAGRRVADRLDTRGLERLYPNQKVIFTHRIAGVCISSELLTQLSSLVRWADVVHLTATYSFPTIPTLLMCRFFDKPLVWSLRGAILDDYAWMCLRKKRLKKIWLKLCNALIRQGRVCLHVTTGQEKMVSLPRIPRANAAIVKNGIEVSKSLPARVWCPGDNLRLLFMGRLAPKKGIENLLEAVKLLAGEPKISLTICGAGEAAYADSLKKRAGKLNLLENEVHFAGHVDGEAKSRAFLDADLCVVPSFSENFCTVVAEALAHSIPVIVSARLPQWQKVEKRGCGLWVDNDPESLAQAIRKIQNLDMPSMGKRGRHWMEEKFAWDVIGQEMLRVYQSLCESKKYKA